MEKDIELILINISGEDRPGLTSALTEILAKYEANILDIGQADIHHTLSLGILFKTNSGRSGDIMKELLFKASELNVTINSHQYQWMIMANGSACRAETDMS